MEGLAEAMDSSCINDCLRIHGKAVHRLSRQFFSVFVKPCLGFILSLNMVVFCMAKTSLSETLFPGLADVSADAVLHSETLIEALFQQDRAEADALIRSSRTLPSLDGFAQYHGQWEQRDESQGNEFSQRFLYGITFRKPLFHWGALEANKQIGQILLRSANENVISKRLLVRNEFQRRVLGLYISIRENTFAEHALEHRKRLLELAEENFQQGDISLQELEQARMNHRHAFRDSLASRNFFRDARHRFLKDFSVDGDVLSKLPKVLPEPSVDLDAWRIQLDKFQESGFRNHPEYRVAFDSVEVQENQILVDRARNRPLVDLVVGANQDDTSYMLTELDDRFRQIYFGGVRVTWNIFDGYETRGRVDLATTLRDQAIEKKKRVARKLGQDALKVLHDLENCQARLNATKETLDWKQEGFEKAKVSFSDGQIPEIELANHRFDFEFHQHQFTLENARCLVYLLRAELLTSLGQTK